jgi:hypothetical protein
MDVKLIELSAAFIQKAGIALCDAAEQMSREMLKAQAEGPAAAQAQQAEEMVKDFQRGALIANGLVWGEISGPMQFSEAVDFCKNYRHHGADSWRLPTLAELQGVLDRKNYNPAVGKEMHSRVMPSGTYWTSTQAAGQSNFAWSVNLMLGAVDAFDHKNRFYFIPVREILPLQFNKIKPAPDDSGTRVLVVDGVKLEVGTRLWYRENHKKTLQPYTVVDISSKRKLIGIAPPDGTQTWWEPEFIARSLTAIEPSYQYEVGDVLWGRGGREPFDGKAYRVEHVHPGGSINMRACDGAGPAWTIWDKTANKELTFFPVPR